MRQQCGADASGPPSSCEPGSTRSEALVLELSYLSRGQAQREKSLRSARVALAQLRLVATPPDNPGRVRAKIGLLSRDHKSSEQFTYFNRRCHDEGLVKPFGNRTLNEV